MLERMRRKGNLVHCWWECRLVQPLWKTVWNFLRKLKLELPFGPAIPLLGLYPKNPETPIQKNLCTPMFTAAQFTIAKYWKQPKCPSVNEWIRKLWYIYTMELYAAERKKELIPFATAWMELESIMHRQFLMKRTEQGTQREQPRAVEKQSMVRVKITPQSFSIAHKLTLKF